MLTSQSVQAGVYRAQELHKLVTDLSRGFMLYPVAHIVEFDTPHETGKTDAELIHGQWIELSHAIRLPRNENDPVEF